MGIIVSVIDNRNLGRIYFLFSGPAIYCRQNCSAFISETLVIKCYFTLNDDDDTDDALELP